MTTTHDGDTATTWRDLADQLTPEQILELEHCDREQVPGLADSRQGHSRQGHLNCARLMAAHNLVQAMHADIAPPADARGTICDWEERDGGRFGRMYTASSRTVGETSVEICGVQYDDGRVERTILLTKAPEDISADDARTMAAALVEAADEMERLG